MISFEYVSFGYDGSRETLAGLNAAIRPGECVLLCGASGCGKTTVTKLINGLIPAFTPGCAWRDGWRWTAWTPPRRPCTSWPERWDRYSRIPSPSFSIWTRTASWPLGWRTQDARRKRSMPGWRRPWRPWAGEPLRAEHLLALWWTKAAAGLWLGLRHGPGHLCAGRATANLDQEAIARLHDEIAGLKRQGRTVVIAEHRLYFLTDLIDQAWYIRQGSLSRRFTREEFQRLTDEERERLGLRTLSSAPCTLPPAKRPGPGKASLWRG